MRFLLDTHILLGVMEKKTGDLPGNIHHLLSSHLSNCYVSVCSLWEMAIKHRLNKLHFETKLTELPRYLNDLGLIVLAIEHLHVLAEIEPEPLTRDPFDRLLLAQCLVEGLKLVTIDRALVGHPLAFS